MRTSNDRISLMEKVVRLIGTREPVLQVEYEPGEVVSPFYQLEIPISGHALLRIPMNTAAVITQRDGEQEVHYSGDAYLSMTPGQYLFKFVHLQQQTIQGLVIRASSVEGWNVSLRLDIFWQAVDPAAMVCLGGARDIITSAVQSVTVDLLRGMQHDAVYQVAGSPVKTVSSEAIEGWILSSVRKHFICRAAIVLGISVQDRRGDPRRVDVIQQSIIEQAKIEQLKQLEIQRKELQALQLVQQEELMKQKETLAVQEAHIARKRIEEEEQVRLKKAEIAQAEAERLYPVQMQQVEVQNQADLQRLQFEQMMKDKELRSNAFTQLTNLILQSQANGLNRTMDPSIQQALAQALSDMVHTPQQAALPQYSERQKGEGVLPKALRERVEQEISRLYETKGVYCEAVEDDPDGTVWARINFKGLIFTVQCGEDFPEHQPRRLLVQAGSSTPQLVNAQPEWEQGIGLANYLMVVFVLVTSQAKAAWVKSNGNGAHGPVTEKVANKEE